MRLLHPGHRHAGQGADRQEGRRPRPEGMAPHLGAHLCRCTGYVKILDAIEAVAQGKTFEPALGATVGGAGAKYEAGAADARRPWLHRRPPRARHAARRAPPHRPRPRRHRRHRHGRGARRAGCRGGVHGRRPPGRAARRHHLQGLAGDDPGRRPHVVRRRRAGHRRRRHPCSTPGPRPSSSTSPTTCSRRTPIRSPRSPTTPSCRCGAPTSTCCRASAYTRGDVDAAFAASAFTVHESFETQRIEHAFLEPESTLAVPSGTGDERTLHVYSGGQGVWDDRDDIAACWPSTRPGDRRAGVERRRVRRQGGHEQPGAGGARRVAARPSGEVHAVARGEPAHARQAAPDPARVLGGLRRRRHASPRCGCGHRRLGRVRQRRDEGARTGGRARLRAVPRAGARHRDDRRAHEQPGVRRVPRLRCQPGTVRPRGRARPARRAGRHQRLGDPQAQRHPARRRVGSRARSWTTAPPVPRPASTRSSPRTTPPSPPARRSGSASA